MENVTITDDMIDREFHAQGFSGVPNAANAAVRAALRATLRARLDPNPRVRSAGSVRRALPKLSTQWVDAKRLAANDHD
ncbi:hypothetical protein [Paraburkholderia sp. D1E]|uniref:hypothetical protein n=1 Tax=Paraburkholderia sp. D1E TaxID=3461398 RepID=UPI0040452A62